MTKGFPAEHPITRAVVANARELVLHGLVNGTTYTLALQVAKANGFRTIGDLVDAILEGEIR